MATPANWIAASRPRTLAAAVVPVVVGVAVAHAAGLVVWSHAVLALVVALSMQIGTNYANDYSDGVRGTDDVRVGPTRLVAGALATPQAVKRAALLTFGVGALGGLALAAMTSWWILIPGAASIAAGWLYTGGPKPYGYAGFGEVFVFVFFGLVAVVGTVYVCSGQLPALAFVAAVPVGLCAVALLVVNNLRDIDTDVLADKHTLAVRLGARRTRALYVACLVCAVGATAAAGALRPGAYLALASVAVIGLPLRKVCSAKTPRGAIVGLGATGLFQLVLGALLTVGIVL